MSSGEGQSSWVKRRVKQWEHKIQGDVSSEEPVDQYPTHVLKRRETSPALIWSPDQHGDKLLSQRAKSLQDITKPMLDVVQPGRPRTLSTGGVSSNGGGDETKKNSTEVPDKNVNESKQNGTEKDELSETPEKITIAEKLDDHTYDTAVKAVQTTTVMKPFEYKRSETSWKDYRTPTSEYDMPVTSSGSLVYHINHTTQPPLHHSGVIPHQRLIKSK
ncbi:uncharacterized protein LOC144361763 [Saccoglossus kowalevskii]